MEEPRPPRRGFLTPSKIISHPRQPRPFFPHLPPPNALAAALRYLSSPVTEPDLIAACQRGEPRAQRQLYERLAGLMLTVCRRYLRRREDAEEALLLGFAQMFRALPAYRGEGSFEGWVRRIMVNQALMELRRREPLTLSFDDFAQPENLAATPATADTQLQADDLLALLGALPPATAPCSTSSPWKATATPKSPRCSASARAPANRSSARPAPCCNGGLIIS